MTAPVLRCVAVALLSPVLASAQASPTAACGPEASRFNVTLDDSAALADPGEGKAQVYFIEIYSLRDKHRFNRPTIRHGIDGSWVGATQGFSYVRAELTPGEHHLCSRWQSHFKQANEISLNNLNVAAGHTYFFRILIVTDGSPGDSAGPTTIDLEPVSEDEGRFLVSQGRPARSTLQN